MYSIVVLIVGALMLVNVPLPAAAAEPVVEVEATDESFEDLELDSDDSVELEMVPDSNEESEVSATIEPQAVFVRGCIRPFRRVSFGLRARGRILYCADPDPFFDVTMRVRYRGFRSFFVDRFFEGRTECIRIQGPNRFLPVRITIGGFRGSFGCFFFSATP